MPNKRFFTEDRMAAIFRWWSAAAVYFFIGWGTSLGAQSTSIDFVFFLGLGIGIAEMFIVLPVIRHMFRTRESLRWRDRSLKQKVLFRLGVFMRSFLIIILIVQTYKVINVTAIVFFGLAETAVFLPGEPVLFGIFYLMFYTVFTSLVEGIQRRMQEV